MTISITGRAVPSVEERNRLFHTYVEPRIDSVRRLVASLTYAGEDADDNFQDVLLALLGAIAFYDPAKAAFSCWLNRVVRNAVADIHRRGQRSVPTTSLDALLDGADEADATADSDGGSAAIVPPALVVEPVALTLPDEAFPALAAASAARPSAAPADRALFVEPQVQGRPTAPPLTIDRADYPNTYDALMALPALQRRALLLNIEGWSIGEVAEELRLTPQNVRQMLCRARASLAARVEKPSGRAEKPSGRVEKPSGRAACM